MLTSTLILVGSIKYKYPLIPPQAQALVAAFEFAVCSFFILRGQLRFDYVSIAYIYWTLIEIAQILLVIKTGYIKRKRIIPYLVRVILVTGVVYGAILLTHNIYAFSYFNTFIAEIIWFGYILKRKDAFKPVELAIFVTKLIADMVAIPVYIGMGDFVNQMICLTLPVLDFAFLVVYCFKQPIIKR